VWKWEVRDGSGGSVIPIRDEMKLEESDYCNVQERATSLGFNVPTDLALLPRNFDSAITKTDLLNESSASTVRKLLRQAGLKETPLEKTGERLSEISESAFQLIMPTLFVGYSLWSQNPTAVNLALNVAANYITDFFKGIKGTKKVKLEIIVERTKGKEFRKLSFEGSPDQLPNNLPELVAKMTKHGR
jgi:hypothetical protein